MWVVAIVREAPAKRSAMEFCLAALRQCQALTQWTWLFTLELCVVYIA